DAALVILEQHHLTLNRKLPVILVSDTLNQLLLLLSVLYYQLLRQLLFLQPLLPPSEQFSEFLFQKVDSYKIFLADYSADPESNFQGILKRQRYHFVLQEIHLPAVLVQNKSGHRYGKPDQLGLL